ncbi:hypothetical protein UUR4_0561 [Ureaplasma urealyticum serovar 4 str. ATCC 27816]|nr:hypothetical protein UUR4_0561 [Ureaplasma urealyticum serovar 4 str. ATCC 27816]
MRENKLIKVDIKLLILDNNKRPTKRSIRISIPIVLVNKKRALFALSPFFVKLLVST